jgi:glycine/D-amino acid oxidase-like deaminating enzyme
VTPDVAVIGGGIVGCALAAFLAEGGARVRLYEREAVAAGASGRNSGVLQHPLDAALTGLYEESLAHYAALGHGFALPADPVGLLVVAERPEALGPPPAEFPELRPQRLEGAELRAAEPALADGLVAHRFDTGRPVPPAAAAHAFATRAREAGAELVIGAAAALATHAGRATGVTVAGEHHPAGAVALAAGPWTPAAAGGGGAGAGRGDAMATGGGRAADGSGDPVAGGDPRLPIAPLWGVVVEVALERPPTHVIEEAGVDELTGAEVPGELFSLVTARGVSALGSTFLPARPDAAALAPRLRERGARFVPGVREARATGLRACARPVSADGRPLLGPLPGVAGAVVAAGHGAWGVTLGPASARLVADGLLGRPAAIAPELAAGRFAAA